MTLGLFFLLLAITACIACVSVAYVANIILKYGNKQTKKVKKPESILDRREKVDSKHYKHNNIKELYDTAAKQDPELKNIVEDFFKAVEATSARLTKPPEEGGFSQLQLITTEDLIEELRSRSSSLLLLRIGKGAVGYDKDLSAAVFCAREEIPTLHVASQELLYRAASQYGEGENGTGGPGGF